MAKGLFDDWGPKPAGYDLTTWEDKVIRVISFIATVFALVGEIAIILFAGFLFLKFVIFLLEV